jgi:hypothetical protein
MIWDGPNYIVQSVARTVAITRPKNLLDQIPDIGDNIKIEYNAGSATVVNADG